MAAEGKREQDQVLFKRVQEAKFSREQARS
jgi:hypothetical protein